MSSRPVIRFHPRRTIPRKLFLKTTLSLVQQRRRDGRIRIPPWQFCLRPARSFDALGPAGPGAGGQWIGGPHLESLVDALDGGELDLEESLSTFESGVKLVRQCSDRLQAAELRIKQVEADAAGTRERDLELEEDA